MDKDKVLEELDKIVPPHSGMSIIDLGIVKDIHIDKKRKKIEVLLLPHDTFCPIRYISKEIERRLKNLGFQEIHVYLKIKNHTIKIL